MSRAHLQLAAAVAAIGILILPAAASAAPRATGTPTPVPEVDLLSSITCPTAKACVTVGSDSTSVNGKSAVITAASGAVKVWSGDLADAPPNAIACAGTKSCVAVANDTVASVNVSTGAMKVTAKPKLPATGIVAMGAVACAGTTKCYAVGFEGTETASNAIVITLSPAGKLLADKKNTGRGSSAIACPTSTLCLLSDNTGSQELIQQLNNGKVGTSHTMPANTYVQSIGCFKASLCYALGGDNKASPELTNELFPLNPKTGAIGTMAKIGGSFSGNHIACISASTCLVAGFIPGSATKPAAVVVTNGKPGTVTKYPVPKVSFADFTGVACASASACYAVGASSSGAIVVKVKS
jgi:hypothetical protein